MPESDFHIKGSRKATGKFQKVVIDDNQYAVLNAFTGEFVSLTSNDESKVDETITKLMEAETVKIARETTKIIKNNHIQRITSEDI
jgi:hypothetical protein